MRKLKPEIKKEIKGWLNFLKTIALVWLFIFVFQQALWFGATGQLTIHW